MKLKTAYIKFMIPDYTAIESATYVEWQLNLNFKSKHKNKYHSNRRESYPFRQPMKFVKLHDLKSL